MRFPEFSVVELLTPAADGAGRTVPIWPSLKNAAGPVFIVCHINQGAANTILLTPLKATAVAGTGSVPITTAVPVWAAQDLATSDVLERQADALTFTTSAATKHKMIVFQIDPAALGAFDCIGISTGASNASNITSAVLIADLRYGSDEPVSLIVD